MHIDAGSYPGIDKPIDRHPGQANNSYIFPGVALGIVTGKISPVTNDDFLVASEVSISCLSKVCLNNFG